MSSRHSTILVGHLIKTSAERVSTGSGLGYEKTYSTFKSDILRPATGISYLPITCTICGESLKIKVISKTRELIIRFALAFFGMAGLYIGLISRADVSLKYFAGIGGGLAFVFSFMRKEQFAIRLVSEKPDNVHALLFKKY